MTQPLASDFPIDPVTTSGTALADILNRFADSVGTNNSGATAPPDTMPGMFWLDTSSGANGTLKMRNAANTGWITISTPGGPFMLADGTVAAPGLAFANEPGLGMYRRGTSTIGWAAAGALVESLSAADPASTSLAINPRAAGSSSIQLATVPTGSSNYNVMYLLANNLGYSIGESLGGTGAARQLSLLFPAGVTSLGNFQAGAKVSSSGGSGPSMRWDGGSSNFLHMQAGSTGGWSWQWLTATGQLNWLNSAGSPLLAVSPDGNFSAAGTISTALAINAGTTMSAPQGVLFANSSYINQYGMTLRSANVSGTASFNNYADMLLAGLAFTAVAYHDPGVTANFRWLIQGTSLMQLENGGNFTIAGASATKLSGTTWANPSGRAIKHDITDYVAGLDALMQVRPRTYRLNDAPEQLCVGIVADEIEAAFPQSVRYDREGAALFTMDPVLWAMVNAIKELAQRLSALEPTAAA